MSAKEIIYLTVPISQIILRPRLHCQGLEWRSSIKTRKMQTVRIFSTERFFLFQHITWHITNYTEYSLLENLIFAQLLKKFPLCHEMQNFTCVFTRARRFPENINCTERSIMYYNPIFTQPGFRMLTSARA